jgi:hypothetical protein
MIHDRGLFGPENDRRVQEAHALRARYLQDLAASARGSRSIKKAVAAVGVGTLAFTALASFSPPRGDAMPPTSSIAPSEITVGIHNLPESERWDTH